MPILYCGIVYTQNKYYTFRTINCILFEFIENEWIVLKQCNTIQHIQQAKAKPKQSKRWMERCDGKSNEKCEIKRKKYERKKAQLWRKRKRHIDIVLSVDTMLAFNRKSGLNWQTLETMSKKKREKHTHTHTIKKQIQTQTQNYGRRLNIE